MVNAVGRLLPDHIDGYGKVDPYLPTREGVFDSSGRCAADPVGRKSKKLASIRAALESCQLRDGMTLSFHHHLRNGDFVLNMVLDEIARLGVRNLNIAASSIFPVHAPLVEHLRRGVVSRITTPFVSGPVAKAISRGELSTPVVMQTHGGRARAIETGQTRIDIAFIAAPEADALGNCNGVHGPSACGVLGYPRIDAQYANKVVVITDQVVDYPACPVEIPQSQVDYVVAVPRIGDPAGIVSGSTRATEDPVGLSIARSAVDVIVHSGLLKHGFSFQTGAGGISLASAALLGAEMKARGVHGSFASGGITGFIVEMLDQGLFRTLFDVQCFDHAAIESRRRNPNHQPMSAAQYASAGPRGAVVDALDVILLGASQIDLEFNVNVTTGSDGVILGGSGGHADTAAGAKLTIVTTKVCAGGFAKILDHVTTITTPGSTVDVVVTDCGVAVNPLRRDVAQRLSAAGVDLVSIESLRDTAARRATIETVVPDVEARIVAIVEYRDGTVLDVVRAVN